MLIRLIVLLALFASAPVAAQAPRDIPAQVAAMNEIAFLKGRWLGRGLRKPPSGPDYSYAQTLVVEGKSSGLVMTIEGLSIRHDPTSGKPGTGSFAVVMYDEREKKYLFRSFGFGELIGATGELIRPGVFQWTTAGPMMLRFVVDGTQPNLWRETGERSSDGGKTWSPTHSLTAWRIDTR